MNRATSWRFIMLKAHHGLRIRNWNWWIGQVTARIYQSHNKPVGNYQSKALHKDLHKYWRPKGRNFKCLVKGSHVGGMPAVGIFEEQKDQSCNKEQRLSHETLTIDTEHVCVIVLWATTFLQCTDQLIFFILLFHLENVSLN